MPESRRQRRVQLPPSLRRTAVNRLRNRRNIRFGIPRHPRTPRRSPMRRPPGIQPIQLPRQLLQAVQVMRRQKVVNIRQRRLHPPRQRLVIRRTQQRFSQIKRWQLRCSRAISLDSSSVSPDPAVGIINATAPLRSVRRAQP